MTPEKKMAAANAKFLAESEQEAPVPQPTPVQVMARNDPTALSVNSPEEPNP